MTRWVVDASVATKWVVQEDLSENAARLGEHLLLAPDTMLVEVASALWLKVRRGLLPEAHAHPALALLDSAPVVLIDSSTLLEPALELALQLRHPVYDCLYLALAMGHDARLVTDDRRLLATCARAPSLASCVIPLNEI